MGVPGVGGGGGGGRCCTFHYCSRTDSTKLSLLFSFLWYIPCFQRIYLFGTYLFTDFCHFQTSVWIVGHKLGLLALISFPNLLALQLL